jgi:hypothetical protein
MTRAITRCFGFFDISVFVSSRGLTSEPSGANKCAKPDEFFSHALRAEFLVSTIRQNLYSFVRILNTSSTIGHSVQPTAVHFPHIHEVRSPTDKTGVHLLPNVRHSIGRGPALATPRRNDRKSAIEELPR